MDKFSIFEISNTKQFVTTTTVTAVMEFNTTVSNLADRFSDDNDHEERVITVDAAEGLEPFFSLPGISVLDKSTFSLIKFKI